MAFPSNQSVPETLAEVLTQVKAEVGRIKQITTRIRDQSAAGPIAAWLVTDYIANVAGHRERVTYLAGRPGIGAYAQAEYPGLVLATEYNAMVARIDATIAWVIANFPKTPGTNELRERTFASSGRTVHVEFSSATLAGFRAELNLLIATID
jgi:hypothetical protein